MITASFFASLESFATIVATVADFSVLISATGAAFLFLASQASSSFAFKLAQALVLVVAEKMQLK